MKVSKTEFEKEKRYLDETKNIIENVINSKETSVNAYKNDVYESKKFIWQNISDMSDPEMYNAMDEEDLNVSIVNKDIVKISKLYRSLENPYFGKLVLDGEDIYIGLTGVEQGNNTYVYDWRAPISNLYYNYENGPVSYKTPDGEVEANVTLKRQFKIEMGKLIDCFDNEVAIDDEMLQEVLLSSSDEKMTNIVNTIQKEQNEIIRYGGKRDLIIEGVAGSGKTSVALHRIAYLLYNQKNLESDNVVIFSPNEVFTNYISNVLPEMGENNALTTTFSDFANFYIPKIKIETLSEFIENFYIGEVDSEIKKMREFKLSLKYKDLIDRYIKEYIDGLRFTKSLGLKKVKVTSGELNTLLHESSKRLSLSDRLDYIAERICNRFDIDSSKNADKLVDILFKFLDIDKNPVSSYSKFLESDIYKAALGTGEISDDKIPYEDLVGMLYLHFELCGYPIVSNIKHVVIDEAQDYTLLDFYLFKRIFKSATFTILGDKNQVINPYHRYESLKEIGSIFTNSKYASLLETYRSTSEIIEYTNKVLGLTDIKSIRKKTDLKVIEKRETDLKEDLTSDIKRLEDLGFKRIAIITKTLKETEYVYGLLESKRVGLITDSILKPVVILPSYLSKGLEFDAVISYHFKDDPYKDEDKYLLYVVLTRAQHSLTVYN